MAKGSRGNKNISVIGGGGGTSAPDKQFKSQAQKNIKGVTGYDVTSANGDKLEFYFKTSGGDTYYGNSINHIDQQTPNNWNESQMISAIKNNGGSATKYSKSDLLDIEIERLKNRAETDRMLNSEYARNKGADIANKGYRNTRKAIRIAKRR